MRILYSHRIQSRDGQSVHLEEMVAAFREAGHTVLVVGPPSYEQNDFGGESQHLARLRRLLPASLLELAELAYNVPCYLRLRRAARDFRPDLVYERYNLYYLAGSFLARLWRLPLYLEVNSPLADERIRFGNLRLRTLARATERHVWQAADRIFAVTAVLKERIRREGVPAEQISVVQNGINPERFADLPIRPARADRVTIGFVGFVRAWHGLDALIAAMASHAGTPRLDLVIIGDGPARASLEAQAAALGIGDRVRFTGVVDRAEVPAHVAGFDIALQPSAVEYASPLKAFDYMAAGRAIVAPDQPNIREILEADRTALLFPPGDAGVMWQAIVRLAENPELRARLGDAARQEILARDYTWPANARRIVAWAQAEASVAVQRPPETVRIEPVT